jgi:hypothetical protein
MCWLHFGLVEPDSTTVDVANIGGRRGPNRPQTYVFLVCELGVVVGQTNDAPGGMFSCV